MLDAKLLPGYAMTSTKRFPRAPETVVIGTDETDRAHCVGSAWIDGRNLIAFKIKGECRYYFQNRPEFS